MENRTLVLQMMKFESFKPRSFYADKKIAVVERSYCDCTFLISEFQQMFEPINTFSFYKNADFYEYREIFADTIFETEFKEEENAIIDDYHTAKSIFGMKIQPKVCIFRSDSFSYKDAKDFDLICEIKPLKSGISDQYEGQLRIFTRDVTHLNLKYKIHDDGVSDFTENKE